MDKEFLMGLMEMPEEVAQAILDKAGQETAQWQEKYRQAVAESEKAMKDLRFEAALEAAVGEHRGRNAKAITALLDVEALKEDPAAVREAVKALKKDCGYLFESPATPPPYAGGTGAVTPEVQGPGTLADALRERFEKG